MSDDFNGFDFDNPQARKRMRYLVVTDSYLDLNNAYAFKNRRELDAYLREEHAREVRAVFKVTPMSPNRY